MKQLNQAGLEAQIRGLPNRRAVPPITRRSEFQTRRGVHLAQPAVLDRGSARCLAGRRRAFSALLSASEKTVRTITIIDGLFSVGFRDL
jgi:hypothetical protein